MPVKSCQINNEPGYKWGNVGKCYAHDGSEESKKEAKKKAIAQGVAIGDLEALAVQIGIVTGRHSLAADPIIASEEELLLDKISFDFDGVLSTKRGQELYKSTLGEKYVITARRNDQAPGVFKITDALNIPRMNIIFTGSNSAKVAKIKELGIKRHYDNNLRVIAQIPGIGKLF